VTGVVRERDEPGATAGRFASGRALAVAFAARPWLWPAALAALRRLAPEGWWRRWPPVPIPDAGYWRFRMETVYGGTGEKVPDRRDIVAFVEWCRSMPAPRG
jgi:hypothetical protein